MTLWVDYTNHAGKRDWREIVIETLPRVMTYPPAEASRHGKLRRTTLCIEVTMIDRGGARRTLALESIHGFAVQDQRPRRGWLRDAAAAAEDHDPMPVREARSATATLVHDAAKSIMDNASSMPLDKIEWAMTHLEPQEIVEPDVLGELRSKISVQEVQIEEAAKTIHQKDKQIDDLLAHREQNRGFTFNALAHANTERQKEWAGDRAISALYRSNELAGEVGEACNIVKKLERERLGIKGSRSTVEKLGRELGDVVICCDLLATAYGIKLGNHVGEAFNDKSRQLGFKTLIT